MAERVFGSILTSPDQVEKRVRQAQWRILHPSATVADDMVLATTDLSMRPFAEHKGQEFSKDVVVLEISGPSVTDLTLVDLPGIIQHSQNAGYVALIEEMVKSYIAKNCLILLVITMKGETINVSSLLTLQTIMTIKSSLHLRERQTRLAKEPLESSPKRMPRRGAKPISGLKR
jgi:hypothetical protein